MSSRPIIKFDIPPGTRVSVCKGCGDGIYWIKTKSGKNMPADPDGTPHWATCREAAAFKKIIHKETKDLMGDLP